MKTLLIIVLSLGAAASPAQARTDSGGGGAAPQPVPADAFRLVVKDVAILDAGGAELDRFHCEWTEPQDDDVRCIRFSGDPQHAYAEIKAAGGSAATVETKVPDLDVHTRTRISERSDGTWLFGTVGTVGGRPHHAGYVCSADGRTCSSYTATSGRRAQRAIRAATSRVKRRARDSR